MPIRLEAKISEEMSVNNLFKCQIYFYLFEYCTASIIIEHEIKTTAVNIDYEILKLGAVENESIQFF